MTARTIGQIAKEAGVGVETVRFYERKGLIVQPPRPRSGRYRRYPDEVVEQIRFIRHAQDLGFSLRQIKELLSLRTDPETDCGDVRERAQAKLEEVNQKIVQLEGIRRALRKLIAACPGRGAVRVCSILEAIAGP
ncbi:MAG: MerR family transcriptional regulator, partial [Nitrospiria bacterium]